MTQKKITDFRPQVKNPNKHNTFGMRLLEKSIQTDGWIGAQTAAADGEIIAGSARQEIAVEKFTDENGKDVEPIVIDSDGSRPVIIRRTDIPTADSARARRLSAAENQVAKANYNPDWELLKEWGGEDDQVRKLFSDDEWREGTGIEPPQVDADPQIDRAAELAEVWHTASGQLWRLGDHRLLIGDCTVRENVERLMGGQKIDCVFTSPPYNQGNSSGDLFSHGKRVENLYAHSEDNMSDKDYMDFLFSVLERCAENVNENHAIVWNVAYNAKSRNTYGKIVFSEKNPFSVFESIVWNKGGSINLPQVGIYSRWCEFVFVMAKGDKYLTSQEYGKPRWNYWETKKQNQMREHHATFPVEFAERGISEFSLENNVVFEPFCGSGTTIIAAHNLNRRCYAMEISEKYGAVILQRFFDATGITPELVTE